MKPTALDPRALVPNPGWSNSLAAGLAFKRCLLEQEQQAALQAFRAVAWSAARATQGGSGASFAASAVPGGASPAAGGDPSPAAAQAAPAFPVALAQGGRAGWLATSGGMRSAGSGQASTAGGNTFPIVAEGPSFSSPSSSSQALISTASRVVALLPDANEAWQRRRLHLTASGEGVHAWLRDSTMEASSTALRELLAQLRQALAEVGLALNGLSLNGRDIPLAAI